MGPNVTESEPTPSLLKMLDAAFQIALVALLIFACSRISGWTAHVLEQLTNNRLIRPRAEYTGVVDRTYKPIDQR